MKEKNILNYIYITVIVNLFQYFLVIEPYTVCKNEIINSIYFYLKNILWIFFILKNIIDCVRYKKMDLEDKPIFEIYKKSKIYLIHNQLYKQNIVFIIIFIMNFLLGDIINEFVIDINFLENIIVCIVFVLYIDIFVYGTQLILEIILDFRKTWASRKLQIKYLKKYLTGKADLLGVNIVLFKDEYNMITNYFSRKDLDSKKEDKNFVKNAEYLPDILIDLGINFKNLKEAEKYHAIKLLFEKFINEENEIIYLNIDKDIGFLKKEFPDIEVEEKLRPYVIAYMETISNKENYDAEILKFEEKCKREYNDIKIQHILVFENLGSFKNKSKYEYMKYLKFYDKEDYFANINNYSSKYVELIEDNGAITIKARYSNTKSKYYPLEPMYDIKKNNSGYQLYKSSFYCDSSYQRVLLLFNYIQYMTKIITYYIYSKNEKNIKEINKDIIKDNFDKAFQYILDNVLPQDYLYDKVKSKIVISKYFEEYIVDYIIPIISIEILQSDEDDEDDEIEMSFAGLGDLLTILRNKIQSHGNINENNIEYIEKTLEILTIYFNTFIAMDKIEMKNENGILNLRYVTEKFISLNNYAICRNNVVLLLQGTAKKEGKLRYIDYFNGKHNKPSEVEISL